MHQQTLRALPVILAALLAPACWAQNALLTGYDWDEKPTLPDTTRLQGATDVLLKRNVFCEFAEAGDQMAYYEVFHLQRYLHDQKAVEENKTVELGTGHIIDLKSIKARAVGPDGTVTELGKDAFKTRTDDREKESSIYFAFEGLRPGSIIEYLFVTQERASYQGTSVRLQFDVPVWEQRYEVLVPELWRFVFKGYNGVPTPDADSSHAGVIRHHLLMKDIPALEGERSAFTDVHRKYLVQKLDALPSKNILDISGYGSATRNYHSNMYPELSSRTRKELSARIKEMNLGYARDLEDRIRTIDQHIRLNFGLANTGDPALMDLDAILRTRNCSEFGMHRLYANIFREVGIEHQLVLTSDRSVVPFDPTFESHNYLHSLLFYFPGIKKYLEPTEFDLGLGYPAPEHMNTNGLFIRNVDVGGVWGGVGSIKPIPELPAEATRHDLDLKVHFNTDVSEATIDVKNDLTGYYARSIQVFYSFMTEENRTNLVRQLLDHFVEEATNQNITVENAESKLFGVQPFVMRGTITTPMFTNQAGDDVIIRVGDLIGPQVEMYVEKPRKLPVDEDYNRYYDRRIALHIPEGWTCTDLAPMAIHKTLEMDGKVMAEFRSSATEKDGVITVEALEYYRTTHVPLEQFEAWRSVINAAADFNKRTLLFSPKKP